MFHVERVPTLECRRVDERVIVAGRTLGGDVPLGTFGRRLIYFYSLPGRPSGVMTVCQISLAVFHVEHSEHP